MVLRKTILAAFMIFAVGCKTLDVSAGADAAVREIMSPEARYLEKIKERCARDRLCVLECRTGCTCFFKDDACHNLITDTDGDHWSRCVMFEMWDHIVLWCNPKKGGVPPEILSRYH